MYIYIYIIITGVCNDVQLVTRAQWGAIDPAATTRLTLPVNMTFIHHTGDQSCKTIPQCSRIIRGIQNDHMYEKRYNDIGYSFLVDDEGRVYEGRGWSTLPAHSPVYNYMSHGICIMGNFMYGEPTWKALDAVKTLIQCGVDQNMIKPDYELFGHRDGRRTDCPGNALYDIIQTWPHYSHRDIPVIG
ncbi:hypothetical protein LSH36_1696g00014 [Paralvinella palmiformis]|uniref:Peptidoglycan-recognition protein n=1 Tax=Paralvinella palmiformis TaxID=53620 RepID=A0AAD9ISK4_9ANNE|nr:hypothetical protein LSH36_1696g00014 [Paralvinella palmiformis]